MKIQEIKFGSRVWNIIGVAKHSETLEEYVVIENNGEITALVNVYEIEAKAFKVDKEYTKYKHYKNKKEYFLIADIIEEDYKEELILYLAEYDSTSLWLRPKDMFFETVEYEGEIVKRFKKVS